MIMKRGGGEARSGCGLPGGQCVAERLALDPVGHGDAVAIGVGHGPAGAGDYQLEIVQLLLAAGATLADVDRNGVAVADRIQSQALRNELSAGQF